MAFVAKQNYYMSYLLPVLLVITRIAIHAALFLSHASELQPNNNESI